MAEIEVRTPEDLDKVFTDMFRFLQDISSRIAYIEMELNKLNSPSVTSSPYIHPSWVSPAYGPGSLTPGKVTLVKSDFIKMLNVGVDNEETKDE